LCACVWTCVHVCTHVQTRGRGEGKRGRIRIGFFVYNGDVCERKRTTLEFGIELFSQWTEDMLRIASRHVLKLPAKTRVLASIKWKRFVDGKSLEFVCQYSQKMGNTISKREIEFLFFRVSQMRSKWEFGSQIKYHTKNMYSNLRNLSDLILILKTIRCTF